MNLEIRGLEFSFGATPVLRGIDLAVQPGEFFALLGPSGSGKSTLLRLIAGFEQLRRGSILIGGEDISSVPPWRRNVGMVFQNYALWPHMSVAENVAFGLEERRLPRAEIERKVAAALALVDLSGLESRRPSQLSGGQQQRVALARTVAIEPKLLLLDEPLSNLDAKLRVHMRRELVSLQRKLGVTTIFVTHDQEEAMTTAGRIAVMDQGVIQQIGTPLDLYDRPANRFVAEFVGTINLIPGSLHKTTGEMVLFVSPQMGSIGLEQTGEIPGHGNASLAFRPHTVSLNAALDVEQRSDDRTWLSGTVSEREFLGESVRYRVRVGGAELIADLTHMIGTAGFAPGSAVQVGLDPRQMRVLRS